MSKDQIVIGVDVGGTNTTIGVVDFNNNMLLENSFLTNPEQGADIFAKSLSNHINNAYSKYINDFSLEGIGIAAPGANYLNGIIESPANLKWGNVKFIELMNNHFHVPINERVEDIHEMFSDKGINAVMCVRGGYGSGQLLDRIDYKLIESNPKIFLGYS